MNKTILAGVLGIILLLVAALVAILVFEPPWLGFEDEKVAFRLQFAKLCTKALPSEHIFGFESNFDKEGNSYFNLGAVKRETGSSYEKVVEKVMDCIKNAMSMGNGNGKELKDDFVIKRPLPLGLVAQQWKGGTLEIYLERPERSEDERILNNLRVDPSSGDKLAMMETWCSLNEACVDCTPSKLGRDDARPEVITVKLKTTEPLIKEKMWGKWSNPVDLWEDVDEEGTRYFYSCRRKTQ